MVDGLDGGWMVDGWWMDGGWMVDEWLDRSANYSS